MRRHVLRTCTRQKWKTVLIYLFGVVTFLAAIVILNNYATSAELDETENPSYPSEMDLPREDIENFLEVRESTLDRGFKKFTNEEARVVGFTHPLRQTSPGNRSSTKVIYLATPHFSEWNGWNYYSVQEGDTTFLRYSCPNPNCRATKDAKEIEKADAVLFNIQELGVNTPPNIRFPHQVWILFGLEPPWLETRDLRRFGGVFNWTMSYRRRSDILLKYGFIGKRPHRSISLKSVEKNKNSILHNKNENKEMDFINCENKVTVQNDNTAAEENSQKHDTDDSKTEIKNQDIFSFLFSKISERKNFAQKEVIVKKNRAVWMVSNCRTDSNREGYVSRLSKIFPVDVFGGCGEEACTPAETVKCYSQMARGYKFYLAFENAICRDYVTEKLFNVLEFEMIPVVLGGADYHELVPEHSVIDAMDFGSPEDLGMYLAEVSRDDCLYKSYFWWKDTYRSYLQPWMCDLCEKLHGPFPTTVKSSEYLDEWWNEGGSCQRWYEDGFQTAADRRVFPASNIKLFEA